jgi:hypothetical protein
MNHYSLASTVPGLSNSSKQTEAYSRSRQSSEPSSGKMCHDALREPTRWDGDGVHQHSGRPTRAPERDESRPADCASRKQSGSVKPARASGCSPKPLGLLVAGARFGLWKRLLAFQFLLPY